MILTRKGLPHTEANIRAQVEFRARTEQAILSNPAKGQGKASPVSRALASLTIRGLPHTPENIADAIANLKYRPPPSGKPRGRPRKFPTPAELAAKRAKQQEELYQVRERAKVTALNKLKQRQTTFSKWQHPEACVIELGSHNGHLSEEELIDAVS